MSTDVETSLPPAKLSTIGKRPASFSYFDPSCDTSTITCTASVSVLDHPDNVTSRRSPMEMLLSAVNKKDTDSNSFSPPNTPALSLPPQPTLATCSNSQWGTNFQGCLLEQIAAPCFARLCPIVSFLHHPGAGAGMCWGSGAGFNSE